MKKIYTKVIRIIVLIYTKINKYLTSAYELFNTSNIGMLPAYIAFFTMWSIVPIIIIWDAVEKFFPTLITSTAMDNEMIVDALEFIKVDYSIGDGGFILFFVIIYLSSKPFLSIIAASNHIYDLTSKTNYLKLKVKSIILALLLLLTIILLLLIPILGEKIIMLVESLVDNVSVTDRISSLRWPLTIIYLTVVIFIIFSFSPSKRINFRFFLPGTIFTTIGWLVATYFYSVYVNEYANYTKIYSSFTSVIILMIWLYLISYILIIGLVINAAYFREKVSD